MKMKMKMDCLPPRLFSLRFLFLVLTISMSFLAPSIPACSEPFKCGDKFFGYPFGTNNSGCGDPALQLDCGGKENKAIMNIGGYQYYIVDISQNWWENPEEWWDEPTIKIISKDQWKSQKTGGSQGCNPSLFNNYTSGIWSNPQFSIAEKNKDVTLWEGCSSPEAMKDTLPCNTSWYLKDESMMCESQVTFPVPVEISPNSILDLNNYSGFWIKWSPTEACGYCASNEELCAYKNDSMKFDCYCGNSSKCHSGTKPSSPSIILGCSIGGGVITAVFIVFIYFLRRRKASSSRASGSDFGNYEGTDMEKGQKGYMVGSVRIFSYQELQQATNYFDKNNELGDGGFGAVYLGKIEDGRTVAVKRLYQENSRRFEQFINEVEILSSLNHPNLVRLYGCTSPQSPMLLLVYEFVANGTLADHLHGSRRSLNGLPWGTRLSIALQTAQALAYLHSIKPPIFHRDVKSNNILLDEHLGAKVADFGLSRLVPPNVSHVTTAPQGTPGYVDPEYHQCFSLTDKSDVYSFGVVLVELISAKVAVDIMRNRSEISLANMAMDKMRRGVLNELVDPDLKIESNHEVKAMVFAVAELAFECLSKERDFRPSMKEVVARLEQIAEMEEKSRESSKLTSFTTIASPLSADSAPIMASERTGQYWAPLSL